MPYDKLFHATLRMEDALYELNNSRVILDCFCDKFRQLKPEGLTKEQEKELNAIAYLVDLYTEQSNQALTELNDNFERIVETVRETRKRYGRSCSEGK